MQRDLFEGFLDEEWNVEEVDGSISLEDGLWVVRGGMCVHGGR